MLSLPFGGYTLVRYPENDVCMVLNFVNLGDGWLEFYPLQFNTPKENGLIYKLNIDNSVLLHSYVKLSHGLELFPIKPDDVVVSIYHVDIISHEILFNIFNSINSC